MDKPVPTNDYAQGQMMGMLCIIRMLRTNKTIQVKTLDRIERLASESLAEYLQKPEEDVILIVDRQLNTI